MPATVSMSQGDHRNQFWKDQSVLQKDAGITNGPPRAKVSEDHAAKHNIGTSGERFPLLVSNLPRYGLMNLNRFKPRLVLQSGIYELSPFRKNAESDLDS